MTRRTPGTTAWPALHINGGGTATREDAQRECLDAIAVALEGDPNEYDSDTQTIILEVSVAPAAWHRRVQVSVADLGGVGVAHHFGDFGSGNSLVAQFHE